MTAPVSSGFPDFGRFASEAQVLEINDINTGIAHNFGYPAKYVGNARALQLWANPPTHGMRLQFQFYGDAAHTVIMDSYVVNMLPGDVVKQPIPILGPWLFVVVQHADALTNSVTIQLWRTPELAAFAGLEGDLAVFSADGVAIGAGASVTLHCPYVMEGEMIWAVTVLSNNWGARLDAADYNGNLTAIDRVDSTAGVYPQRETYAPPWHLQLLIVNQAAAASTYRIHATRKHNR